MRLGAAVHCRLGPVPGEHSRRLQGRFFREVELALRNLLTACVRSPGRLRLTAIGNSSHSATSPLERRGSTFSWNSSGGRKGRTRSDTFRTFSARPTSTVATRIASGLFRWSTPTRSLRSSYRFVRLRCAVTTDLFSTHKAQACEIRFARFAGGLRHNEIQLCARPAGDGKSSHSPMRPAVKSRSNGSHMAPGHARFLGSSRPSDPQGDGCGSPSP